MKDNLKKNIRKASTANSILLILFIAIAFAAAYGISALFSVLPEISNFDLDELRILIVYELRILIVYIFQYLIIIPFLILIFRKTKLGRTSPKISDCICKPKMPAVQVIKWIFISLFAIYAVSYISNFIFTFIQMLTGIELHAATVVTENSWLSIATNIWSIMFMAPVLEELFFRGTLLRNVSRYGSWSMIIAMGIMFGLWHMNYVQTLFTAVLGICTGFLIIKTGSIIPSIILHFILNTIGTVQSLLIINIDLKRISSGDIKYIMDNISSILPISLTGFLIIGIMITGLVLLIIEFAKNGLQGFQLPKSSTGLSERKTFVVYFSSPVTIAVTLILIGITIYNAFYFKSLC